MPDLAQKFLQKRDILVIHIGVHEAFITERIDVIADKNRHHAQKGQQEGEKADFVIPHEIPHIIFGSGKMSCHNAPVRARKTAPQKYVLPVKKKVILQHMVIMKQFFFFFNITEGTVGKQHVAGRNDRCLCFQVF